MHQKQSLRPWLCSGSSILHAYDTHDLEEINCALLYASQVGAVDNGNVVE